MVFISQIGKQKKGKRGSIKILQTMVNDLRMEMKVRWWKSQDLFQPLVAAGGDERKKFKRDCHGDGPAGPSNIRMLGAPKVCGEGTFTEVAVAQLLEELLVGDGPLGQWPEEFLGEWLDDVQVTHFEELEINLFSYASFTTDGIPRLETIDNVSGEIDNSFFCIKLPRPDADFDAFCDQLDLNVIYDVDDFAPWSQHLIDDHCFRYFCCQVGVNNACEPLMLCTILLGCISSILSEINALLIMLNQTKKFFIIQHEGKSPLRGAICDIWEPTRTLSPRFTDLWHSNWEDRREAAVLLEASRITKLAVLEVPTNYDPELALKLGLHPGDMRFASCIARTNY